MEIKPLIYSQVRYQHQAQPRTWPRPINPKYNSFNIVVGQICFKQFILYNKLPIYKTLKDKLGLTIFVCQVNVQTLGLAYRTKAYAIIFASIHVVNLNAEKPYRAYGQDDWTQL